MMKIYGVALLYILQTYFQYFSYPCAWKRARMFSYLIITAERVLTWKTNKFKHKYLSYINKRMLEAISSRYFKEKNI